MGDIFDSVDTVWGEKTEAFLVLGPMLAEAFAFIATTYHLCLNSRHRNFGWRRTTCTPERMRGCEGHELGIEEDQRRIARIRCFSSKETFPVINYILFDEILG